MAQRVVKPTRRSSRRPARHRAAAALQSTLGLEDTPLGLEDTPLELRIAVWNSLLPANVILQINPGGGPYSLSNSAFNISQTIRLTTEGQRYEERDVATRLWRPNAVTQGWAWEDVPRLADRAKSDSVFEWHDSARDLSISNIFSVRQTSRQLYRDIEHVILARDFPIMLTSPGIPDLTRLSLSQRNLVQRSSTLIFRHGHFNCVPIGDFLDQYRQFELLVMPTQYVTLDVEPDLWNSLALTQGIQLGEDRAHHFLERALADFLPKITLPQPDGRPLRWVGEIIIRNWEENGDVDADEEASWPGLRCLIARDVTAQAESIFLMGVERLDDCVMSPCLSFTDVIGLATRFRTQETISQSLTHDTNPSRRDIAARFLGETSSWDGNTPSQVTERQRMLTAFDSWHNDIPTTAQVWNYREQGGCYEGDFLLQSL